jgi:ATP-grasp domain-containing protein
MHVVACRYDRAALEALLDTGADVSLVIDAWESANRSITTDFLEPFAGFHVVASFDDMTAMSQLAIKLADGKPVDRVLSLAEYGQLGAAYLATVLGHDSPSIPLSILVRDKRAMKRVARAAGLPCARQVLVEEESAAESAKQVGYPAVLKPVSGMGTVNTWLVWDESELIFRLTEAGEQAMIAEEFITGDEYHVDAVWRGGQAVVLGVGRYSVPRLQLTVSRHQNGSALLSREAHPSVYDALEELSRQVNKAFGIESGITHSEFFHTPDGQWLFSEIATRPGGAAVPQMFKHLGADLREIWIGVETDHNYQPRLTSPPAPYVGWINVAPPVPGTVRRAPTEKECRAFEFVIGVNPGHRPGDHVREIHPSVWSWMVEYTADTWDAFVARGAELERALTFDMESE